MSPWVDEWSFVAANGSCTCTLRPLTFVSACVQESSVQRQLSSVVTALLLSGVSISGASTRRSESATGGHTPASACKAETALSCSVVLDLDLVSGLRYR